MTAEVVPLTPRPPAGLRTAGKRLWRDMCSELDFEAGEFALLGQACALEDEIQDLRQALREDGVTVPGSKGQPVPNGLLRELRGHIAALAQLLRQLRPDAALERSAHARHAAEGRWIPKHRARGRLLGTKAAQDLP